MKLHHVAFAAALFANLVACGKSTPSGDTAAQPSSGAAALTSAAAPKGGSCNEPKVGVCTEFGDDALGMAEGACTSLLKGTYAKAACPRTNLIGYCEKKDEKEFFYFGNGVAPLLAQAKKECEEDPLAKGAKFVAEANVEATAKEKAMPTPDRIAGSCQHAEGNACDDYYGRGAEVYKSLCDGKWTDNAPCSAENLVGSCLAKGGKINRYYTAELKNRTVPDITETCEKFVEGTYVAGPAAPKALAGKVAPTPGGAKAKK